MGNSTRSEREFASALDAAYIDIDEDGAVYAAIPLNSLSCERRCAPRPSACVTPTDLRPRDEVLA
jgi:hypothetical protein